MIKFYHFVCKYSRSVLWRSLKEPLSVFLPSSGHPVFQVFSVHWDLCGTCSSFIWEMLSTLQSCTICANCVTDWPDVFMSCSGCRKLRNACRPSRASFQTTFTVMHAKLLSKILKWLVPQNLILVSLRCCNKNIRIIVTTLNSTGKLLTLQRPIWEVLGLNPETCLAEWGVCGFH